MPRCSRRPRTGSTLSRPHQLRLCFAGTEAACLATLLWDAAPRTYAAVAGLLPIRGLVHQAIYSGSESVLLLPQVMKLDKENATSAVRRGDLAFTWLAA